MNHKTFFGLLLILISASSIAHSRQYDPSTGRFLQEDPVFSTNLYTYGMNNPITYTDPFGQWISVGKNGDEYSIDITLRIDPVAMNEKGSYELNPFASGWLAMAVKYDMEKTWSIPGKLSIKAQVAVSGTAPDYADYHVMMIRDFLSEYMGKAVFIDYHDMGKGHVFSHEFTHWLGAKDTYSKVYGRESIMPIISSPGTCGISCLNDNSFYLLDRIIGNKFDPNSVFHRNPAIDQIMNGGTK
jgi:hypothetical protein